MHMHLFSRHKTNLIAAGEALPGRDRRCPCPSATTCSAPRSTPPFPEGLETGRLRPRLLLGRRARLLGGARRLHDRGRLRRRLHAEPDLRGGLLRADRPRRGRARRLRPEADQLRRAAEALLGGPRPDPGDAPGQRRRHPVPLGDLHDDRRAARRPPTASRDDVPGARCASPATARSRPRSRPPARSTTPRTTTSSTSPRTRTATAASAAPASPARSASASPPPATRPLTRTRGTAAARRP